MNDIDFSSLQSKYNFALSKIRMLTERICEKEKAWDKKDASYQITEALAKNLCDEILNKDRNRVVLGTDSSSDDDIHTMLRNASDSYRSYCRQKTADYLYALKQNDQLNKDCSILRGALCQLLICSGADPESAERQIAELLIPEEHQTTKINKKVQEE